MEDPVIPLLINQHLSWRRWVITLMMLVLLNGCTLEPSTPVPSQSSTLPPDARALSDDEITTLSSLEQVDDFLLYTLYYSGAYAEPTLSATNLDLAETARLTTTNSYKSSWGCSLFAALGDPGSRLYGRNFDWRFSPAVLLFTEPPDGYTSVSMVDIEYLGFGGSRARDLIDLPLSERRALLDAPALPFNGMNAPEG